MNERIRELAEQAKIYFREVEFSGEVLSDGEIDFEDFKNFAELIVRECMWKIMVRKDEAIDNDWRVDEAMSTALSDISEHFGVER